MLRSRSRGFIQQYLIVFDGRKEFFVKASSWNQVNGSAQAILQIQQQTGKLQTTNAAFVDSKVNITICRHVSAGIRAKQVYSFCSILLSQP